MQNRSLKQKRNKKSKFKKAFIIYLSVLALLMAGALVFLWISLSDYQENLNQQEFQAQNEILIKQAPQRYFTEFLNGLTEDDLTDLWFKENPDSLSQKEDIKEALRDTGFFSTPYECFKASDYTEKDPKYLVKTGGKNFMEVTLFGSGNEWSVYDVHFLFSEEGDNSYKIPTDSTLMINGIEVSRDSVETEEVPNWPKNYLDSLTNPVSFSTYRIKDLLNNPVVEIKGARPYVLTELSPKEYCYTLSEEEADPYIKKANDFVRSLLHYYTYGKQSIDENMNSVLSRVPSSSQAATLIKGSYDGVLWRYSYPNVTYNLTEGPVIVDADNCLHVDIHYESPDENLSEITSKEGTYRICLLDLGDGFKIYYFELIN